jgi:YHS domain-containing protein
MVSIMSIMVVTGMVASGSAQAGLAPATIVIGCGGTTAPSIGLTATERQLKNPNPPPVQEAIMYKSYITFAFAGALLLGLSTAALAATGEFDNMCAEGLSLHKDIKTDCSINTTIKGKTYCFGSEQAKADFMKNPEANLAKAQEYYSSTHKKM